MVLPEPLANVTSSVFSPGAEDATLCRAGPVRIEHAEVVINTTTANALHTT
jgi:hypothetical protein